jgi:sialidase-1
VHISIITTYIHFYLVEFNMKWFSLAAATALASLVTANVPDPAKDATPYHTQYILFRSGNMASPDKLSTGIGFHTFRIPAVVKTATGRMLAFAEGRRWTNEDFGDINLVYKRTKTTTSGGAVGTDWEGLKEVWGAGADTWGNPTPVVDGNTIYLFMSWNGANYSQNGHNTLPNGVVTKPIDSTPEGRRRLFLAQSTDDGATWSTPVDMTTTLTPDGQAWDAVGPGNGIVLTTGEIVVPAQGRNIIGRGTPGKRTWSREMLPGAGSEGTIAQTPDGHLYRNDRAGSAVNYRIVARGNTTSFSSFVVDGGLPDPGCEGSVLSYNYDAPARTIFMNSADPDSRRAMRVRISYDADAKKYDWGRKLSDSQVPGTSTKCAQSTVGCEGGYSSMAKTPDYKIGALVESNFYQDGNGKNSNMCILWRRFNLSWILNGPNN